MARDPQNLAHCLISEPYSEPYQRCKMERFAKITLHLKCLEGLWIGLCLLLSETIFSSISTYINSLRLFFFLGFRPHHSLNLYCSNSVRRSHQKCSIKKPILTNSAIFTGEQLCCSFFLILKVSFEYCEIF